MKYRKQLDKRNSRNRFSRNTGTNPRNRKPRSNRGGTRM